MLLRIHAKRQSEESPAAKQIANDREFTPLDFGVIDHREAPLPGQFLLDHPGLILRLKRLIDLYIEIRSSFSYLIRKCSEIFVHLVGYPLFLSWQFFSTP